MAEILRFRLRFPLAKQTILKALLAQGADTEIRSLKYRTARFEAVAWFASPNAFAQTAIHKCRITEGFVLMTPH